MQSVEPEIVDEEFPDIPPFFVQDPPNFIQDLESMPSGPIERDNLDDPMGIVDPEDSDPHYEYTKRH